MPKSGAGHRPADSRSGRGQRLREGLTYTIVIHGDEDMGYFIDEVYIPGLPIARDNETRWSNAPLAFGAGQEVAHRLIDDAKRKR